MEGFFQRYLGLYRPIITKLNELMSTYELSYSLWQVIYYLKNNGPDTLIAISAYYQVEKPTITRRVHRLQELDIVRQIPGKDKREKIIELTESGEAIYLECRQKITALEHRIMDGITPAQQEALFEAVPLLRQNIVNTREDME
ncbi:MULTISPECIES: MarR family transcriptional regulator [unclassified Paenibacillus]|uniref:MarR family winged helix-turn-helix transcriptional regulator n=1 Tax=Paenibacillus provencensis TaxID=441151 RepID=A0ABW3PTL3_9BACL|nr:MULTISPECIES: MarR family transcriptional regulator [unclassified Paenibacillus]MCM3129696.1 MarR family transcriptional regulator [Paenibacillus sp. MER 78]SFS54813.1 DNA-binding transcriptional regulator, MarR family [Paenibacillus sp. 453mf]